MDASKEDLFVYNVLVHACIYCATDKKCVGKTEEEVYVVFCVFPAV